MKRIILAILILVFLVSCKDNQNEAKQQIANYDKEELHPGKKLLQTNCYICHSPSAGHNEARIAPPMEAVKRHYKTDGVTKQQFVNSIKTWLKDPKEETSKMPGAIRNYGVMPYTEFPDETINQIADYMYDNDLETPDWFEDHFNEERGKGKGMRRGLGMNKNQTKNYTDIGLQYALSTKAQLGKNLMGTIQKKGTIEAVTFCNERAYALTDSMAKVHNANIKRVSDKPRNQNNKANYEELEHISAFKAMVERKEEVKPILDEHGEQVNFYFPITTNSMCLQCHGKLNEHIKPETYNNIKQLYPNDQAVGYDVNQVRGIWSITFKK